MDPQAVQLMNSPGTWLQFGAFGVVCTVFIMVMRWLMGRFAERQEEIREEIQLNREMFLEWSATQTMMTVALQKQLLYHDSQVRGINPTTGKDVDERTRMAYDQYKKIQVTMDEIVARQIRILDRERD